MSDWIMDRIPYACILCGVAFVGLVIWAAATGRLENEATRHARTAKALSALAADVRALREDVRRLLPPEVQPEDKHTIGEKEAK